MLPASVRLDTTAGDRMRFSMIHRRCDGRQRLHRLDRRQRPQRLGRSRTVRVEQHEVFERLRLQRHDLVHARRRLVGDTTLFTPDAGLVGDTTLFTPDAGLIGV